MLVFFVGWGANHPVESGCWRVLEILGGRVRMAWALSGRVFFCHFYCSGLDVFRALPAVALKRKDSS